MAEVAVANSPALGTHKRKIHWIDEQEDPFFAIECIKHKPISFLLPKRRKLDEEDSKPENFEEEEEEEPPTPSMSNVIMDTLLTRTGSDKLDEKEASVLLEGTPKSFELLRNTAINSFSAGEKPTEKQIQQKIEEIKNKEVEHIKTTHLQRILRTLYENGGSVSILDLLGGDDEDNDDEDYSYEIANEDEETN